MFIYLLVMALQVVQTGKPLGDLAYAIGMIAAMEVMVDWLKHAFVVKFNFIPPDIYAKFTTALCVDLAEPRGRRRGDSGHAMAIAARIGFVPIPLLCLRQGLGHRRLRDDQPEAPLRLGPLRPRLALHVRPTPFPALPPARRRRPTP